MKHIEDVFEIKSLKKIKMTGFSTSHVLPPGDSNSVNIKVENMPAFYVFFYSSCLYKGGIFVVWNSHITCLPI